VLPLTEIRDLEVMRQIASCWSGENAKLHAKVDTFFTELAKLRSGDGTPTVERRAFLRELLAQRERTLFGASPER
jgi:cell division protein FtsB